MWSQCSSKSPNSWQRKVTLWWRSVGVYGRMARRRVGEERRCNGNELAINAIGAHCRRSMKRCRFSFGRDGLSRKTHVT